MSVGQLLNINQDQLYFDHLILRLKTLTRNRKANQLNHQHRYIVQ